jgi:hypothetical protein
VLSEVEGVADTVGIIRQGRMVDVDDVATLRHRAGQTVSLVFAEPVDPAEFEGVEGVEDLTVAQRTVTCRLHGEPDALLKAAARHHVVAWSAESRELEDLFLDFYRVPAAEPAEPHDGGERRCSLTGFPSWPRCCGGVDAGWWGGRWRSPRSAPSTRRSGRPSAAAPRCRRWWRTRRRGW